MDIEMLDFMLNVAFLLYQAKKFDVQDTILRKNDKKSNRVTTTCTIE